MLLTLPVSDKSLDVLNAFEKEMEKKLLITEEKNKVNLGEDINK